MLADEPDALPEREALVRPFVHGCLEGCLSERDVADSRNRPTDMVRVPIPQLHAEAHVGDVVQVRVRQLA